MSKERVADFPPNLISPLNWLFSLKVCLYNLVNGRVEPI